MNERKDATVRSESMEEFKMSHFHEELLRIDGEPIEFEWNILPGIFVIADSSENPG